MAAQTDHLAHTNAPTRRRAAFVLPPQHPPPNTHHTEITRASFHPEGFAQIFGVLDMRLQEKGENWRLAYKSLLLMEYMAKHGPLVRPSWSSFFRFFGLILEGFC